ncbi:MAG: homocitrate synthase, partial [Candidatus Omnitrophica bacterium]|nr:homocitrate synthase [Candidatus Omnitrophota bacterium]
MKEDSEKLIRIIDVTNRDGVQTSRLGLAKLQKTIVNVYLNKMGIFQSEFGFPITLHERNYINANLELAKRKVLYPIRLSGWIRAIEEDVKKAVEFTDIEYLNMSISTSDQMIKHKFGGKIDREGIIKSAVKAIKLAKKMGIKELGINAEDASRT